MATTIIHNAKLTDPARDKIFAQLGGEFEQRNNCHIVHDGHNVSQPELLNLSEQLKIDINRLPDEYQPQEVGLLISDMDSTMIAIECIDEIADFMDIKDQVSSITESAMCGEIDFETSLRRRVGLLKNLSSDVLSKVYQQRLRLNPGAMEMLTGLRQKNIKTALVSGGFSYFTERLQQRLELDYQLANELEIADNSLTGKVLGEIVTASRKAAYLEQICTQIGIKAKRAIAIGDGANDLEMLSKAGLGVAYHAKPVVQKQADVALNYSGLDSVLDFVNY
jgi:phosphoserine phosphatase